MPANPEVGIRGTTYIELNDEGCLAEGNACLEGIAKEDTIKCLVGKDAKTRKVDVFFFAQRIQICMNLLWKYITDVYIYAYTYMFRTPQEKSPFPILHPQLLHFFSRHFQHVGNPNITKML